LIIVVLSEDCPAAVVLYRIFKLAGSGAGAAVTRLRGRCATKTDAQIANKAIAVIKLVWKNLLVIDPCLSLFT
jgi:hypothetical protein